MIFAKMFPGADVSLQSVMGAFDTHRSMGTGPGFGAGAQQTDAHSSRAIAALSGGAGEIGAMTAAGAV